MTTESSFRKIVPLRGSENWEVWSLRIKAALTKEGLTTALDPKSTIDLDGP